MSMLFRLVFAIAFVVIAFNSFAQCSCGCAAGGSLFGDYSGNALNEKQKFTVEASYDYKAFKPHLHTTEHVHNHTQGSTVATEEEGLEMKAMSTALVGLRYGLTKRMMLTASVPFAILHAQPSGQSGIGDVSFAGVYQFLKTEKLSLNGLVGVELPTGKQVHETLASDVVIGSGSFDPLAGLVATYAQQNILVRVNALYKHNLEGTNNIQYGNNLTSSFSIGYSNSSNASLCAPPSKQKATWAASAIGLVEQTGLTYANNIVEENSGGTTAYGGGGFSVIVGRVAIPVSILIPVYQRLNGEQHQMAYKARIGAAVTF